MENNLENYKNLLSRIQSINFETLSEDEARDLSNEIEQFSGSKKVNLLLNIIDAQDFHKCYRTDAYNTFNKIIFTEENADMLYDGCDLIEMLGENGWDTDNFLDVN